MMKEEKSLPNSSVIKVEENKPAKVILHINSHAIAYNQSVNQ